MAKLPLAPPAAVLAARLPAARHVLPAGSRLWRIYRQGGDHPSQWWDFRYFGPTDARFDHHLRNASGEACVQSRGIFYAGGNEEGILICLAEYFQSTRTINRKRRFPWLVGFDTVSDAVLLDLCSVWPTAAGASMAINTGPRIRARTWSSAIYDAYSDIEGLWYGSSMYMNKPAVALYERACHIIPSTPIFHRSLDDSALFRRLQEAATTLRYRLI